MLGLRGIFRLTPFKDVMIASGSGVGGGSIVYANTLYRAAPSFFANPQWAALADWASVLKPHYDTATRMLGVQTVPFESDNQKLSSRLARLSESRKRSRARRAESSSARRAVKCPIRTSAAPAHRAPGALAAEHAWSAAALARRTPC